MNIKALGLAGGVLWGATLFLVTWICILFDGYGSQFLDIFVSVYPGYSISAGGSLLGLIYGFVDAFFGFFVFAWLYNYFASKV